MNCSANENRELISIVIPIYNAEKYLSNCLDSLICQTYPDLEIVCVNDGSQDQSLNILREYQSNDNRIVIIDKKNEGVSQARNTGLKNISGKYVMFVDADDWLDQETCEAALNTLHQNDADVVMWSYVSETENRKTYKKIYSEKTVFEKENVVSHIHRRFIGLLGEELSHPELADSLCPVWGKLYKRQLIGDSRAEFIDLKKIGTYEDGMYNLQIFQYANRVVYIPECYYHYRRESSTSVTSGYKEQLFEQWQTLFEYMAEYIQKNQLSKEYLLALDNRIALSMVGLGLNIIACPDGYFKKIKKIKEILLMERYKNAYQTLEFRHFPVYWKLFYGCAKMRFATGVYWLLVAIKIIISR